MRLVIVCGSAALLCCIFLGCHQPVVCLSFVARSQKPVDSLKTARARYVSQRKKRPNVADTGAQDAKLSRDAAAVEQFDYDQQSNLLRLLQFWMRVGVIYGSYKILQAQSALLPLWSPDEANRQHTRDTWWSAQHEKNSDRLLDLCLSLRGFYLKSGQFLGTRHDICPPPYIRKLSTLHDRVPPMSAKRARKVVEQELKKLQLDFDQLFASFDLTKPIGSASLSQVHEAKLRKTGEKVAVKVQYPGARRLMAADITNLSILARYLQRFELKFDLVNPLKELKSQLLREFDFTQEASHMQALGPLLHRRVRGVKVPQPRLATKKLLIMSFLDGVQITRLREVAESNNNAVRRLSPRMQQRLLRRITMRIADAWGVMIFSQDGLHHADPHPGNFLIMPRGHLGLLDWGQVKALDQPLQRRLASFVLDLKSRQRDRIAQGLLDLGIHVEDPSNNATLERMAVSMFDTRKMPGVCFNIFSPDYTLKSNAVLGFPQDLFFVLRSCQLLRGLSTGLSIDLALCDRWAPHAKRFLREQKRQGAESIQVPPPPSPPLVTPLTLSTSQQTAWAPPPSTSLLRQARSYITKTIRARMTGQQTDASTSTQQLDDKERRKAGSSVQMSQHHRHQAASSDVPIAWYISHERGLAGEGGARWALAFQQRRPPGRRRPRGTMGGE
ncbi:unnamed protein product [Vitrella brassicaformis CCMP3155]|uniref:Protein kinase domain-containing protein n=1 Tax=Vitrella brassicaformis (strain CCMP3155) TaxID=1169540 RepID=A0A0G4F3L2_VITBC|nr:unnamed protein product [Vitrella brassicaformis CCMP3155]|mmetsp:Transcript_29445/g.73310  ORF Transcript_29445/g.73310 Transcript_29445/m.73310 type:complete len:670 (-) Transcript_29445:644-2653(-)|eukprot:CEM06643.1 unnamed protein product [Vitrella brassicaformis CCMP3155]